jgi:O-antigen ligase
MRRTPTEIILRRCEDLISVIDTIPSVSSRRQYALMVLVLAAGILPVASFLPRWPAYVTSALLFVVALAAVVLTASDRRALCLPVRTHPALLLPLVVLWLLFAAGTLLYPTLQAFRRLPVFVGLAGLLVFVIPAVIERRVAYQTFSTVAAVLVLVALPTVFLGPLHLGPLTLDTLRNTYSVFGLELHNPYAIFRQANHLGFLATTGVLCAFGSYRRSGRRLFVVLAAVCALGVVVTRFRSGMAALAAVAILYVVYWLSSHDWRVLAVATAVGACCGVAGFVLITGVLPGLGPVRGLGLHNRLVSWRTTAEVVARRPVIGWGPGNAKSVYNRLGSPRGLIANSYFRMFVMSGILGGLAYLALCASALGLAFNRLRRHSGHRTTRGFVGFSLLVVILILQMFIGGTLFGLALFGVLGSLFVGYVQPTGRFEYTLALDAAMLSRARGWLSMRGQRAE